MKSYTVQFGSGNPQGFTGLAPTFLTFFNLASGTTNTPPTIAETITGKTGVYFFNYGTTQPISFLLDAATTWAGSGRYVVGQLDPADRADEYGNTLISYGLTMMALGTTSVALGNTGVAIGQTALAYGVTNFANLTGLGLTVGGIGNTSIALGQLMGNATSSYGSTMIDPTTVFGFLKRSQEIAEGNQTYTKATGVLDYYVRGGSTLLSEKTISDSSTSTTRT